MGGYGLHIPPSPAGIRFFPQVDQEEYYVISGQGMRLLSSIPEGLDDIPDLSEADIDLRSKGSWFAKSLFCA
jgi:hypothetical protein